MDCCTVKPKSTQQVPCPSCKQVGKPIAELTILAILKPEVGSSLIGMERRFCRTSSCDVVYYGADGRHARKHDSQVRVGLKEAEDPIPLCYCFGFTRADVEREVAQTGASSIPARITAEVKAGRCACEVKNPAGSCCLGEVNKAVKEAKLRASAVGPSPQLRGEAKP